MMIGLKSLSHMCHLYNINYFMFYLYNITISYVISKYREIEICTILHSSNRQNDVVTVWLLRVLWDCYKILPLTFFVFIQLLSYHFVLLVQYNDLCCINGFLLFSKLFRCYMAHCHKTGHRHQVNSALKVTPLFKKNLC